MMPWCASGVATCFSPLFDMMCCPNIPCQYPLLALHLLMVRSRHSPSATPARLALLLLRGEGEQFGVDGHALGVEHELLGHLRLLRLRLFLLLLLVLRVG